MTLTPNYEKFCISLMQRYFHRKVVNFETEWPGRLCILLNKIKHYVIEEPHVRTKSNRLAQYLE